jgi:tetratricopeptide (TPR) repeat protein
MPTKKKAADGGAGADVNQAYEAAVGELAAALETMHKGDFESARQGFDKIAAEHSDEGSLAERARMYSRYCAGRLAGPAPEPQGADEMFYAAVIRSNNGDADGAIELIDRALKIEPESPRLLYARASAAAIKSDADSAVQDLRRAIAVDPQVRFQAANDPDFEVIREEPAFIDIIEPTPSGA